LRTGSSDGMVRPIHIIAVLGAELAWAPGTLLQPRFAAPSRVLNFTCLQMLVGAVFQLAMACLGREWVGFAPSRVSLVSWVALLYLAVFCSILAFSCYAYLVAHVAPQRIATYALVNPVIALALGALVLGERITPVALVATVLVLDGVMLELYRGRSARLDPSIPQLVAPAGASLQNGQDEWR